MHIMIVIALLAMDHVRVQCAPEQKTPSRNSVLLSIFIIPCGEGSECVPHNMCNDDIGSNQSMETAAKYCADKSEVCCTNIKEVPEIDVTTFSTADGCGFRNMNGTGVRITLTEENETKFSEIPWMVAVFTDETIGNETYSLYKCGASLIHPRVVMTAAHCVLNNSVDSLKIRAGEWDIGGKNEPLPHQNRDVAEKILHQRFTRRLLNDIALLVLEKPVNLAPNVNTVCLPPSNMNFDNVRCLASGWGKDTFDESGSYSYTLKKIGVPIVGKPQCETALRTTRLGRQFRLHRSLICAGGEKGMDTCTGDGGSPLVCPIPEHPGRYYQVGIVAGGIGCGSDIPAVYASIPELRNWIDVELAARNINTKSYSL